MPVPRDLSIRELSDRIQINDLLVRYTRAIDTKDWNLLDSCFLPDADVDYTATGGVAGKYPEVRAWLAKALAPFPITVHYITNSIVTITGDKAKARTLVYNPMFFGNPDGSPARLHRRRDLRGRTRLDARRLAHRKAQRRRRLHAGLAAEGAHDPDLTGGISVSEATASFEHDAQVEYDPFSYEQDRDPYPVYRWMRNHAPAYRNERLDFYAFTRYRDNYDAFLDAATYSSSWGTSLEYMDAPSQTVG